MSEKLANRREAAADQYERTAQYQAMQYLNYLGVTKKLSQISLFHGRVSKGEDEWSVDPSFDNAGDNTGNNNINKVSALNTSDYETANRFALARAHCDPTRTEIHRIMSDDPDAVIIDGKACRSFKSEKQKDLGEILDYTLLNITEGSPLSFENRNALNGLKPDDFVNEDNKMYKNEINQVSQKLGLDPSVVKQIGSAINTRRLLQEGKLEDLCEAFREGESSIDNEKIPINIEYLKNWFRKNHIVGYKIGVNSATLDWDRIDNYLLFDLDNVNTDVELERKQRERYRKFGQIALAASKNNLSDNGNLLDTLSKNHYIKPAEIIQLAKKTPGYKGVFEADAGNWEKFTLEEHTEATLEFFDKNYADVLPASMLPVMRMALLVHDLGKPEAAGRNDKGNQKQYNDVYAEHFLKKNNVDEPTIKLIRTMIGEGMDRTERWMVHRDKNSGQQLRAFCKKTMQEYLGTDQVNPKTVMGFMDMLEVLQTCDSAAYTTMAVTRDRGNDTYYRNYGSFNSSFEEYHGFTGRKARFKQNE